MQTSSNPIPDTVFIPRDDESEAERLLKLAAADGIGESQYLTDDDVRGYSLHDYGMNQ